MNNDTYIVEQNQQKNVVKTSVKSGYLLKSIIYLISGTGISQLIPILLSPILSRVFTPAEFGLFAVYNAVVLIISSVANLRYDVAMMSEKEDASVFSILRLAIFLSLMSTILFFVISAILTATNFFVEKGINFNVVILMTLGILSVSITNSINIWLNKYAKYKTISLGFTILGIVQGGLSLFFGLVVYNTNGLILSFVLGHLVQVVFLIIILLVYSKKVVKEKDKKDMFYYFKKHSKYPKYNIAVALLNVLSNQIPILMLSFIFSNQESGWYSMSMKVANAPMILVGTAIGNVYFKIASDYFNNKNEKGFADFTARIFNILLIIGSIPTALLLFYGDRIIPFVLGSDWKVSGLYTQVLALFYFVSFATVPLTHIFNITNKQNLNFVYNLIIFVSRTAAIILTCLIFKNHMAVIVAYSIVSVIVYIPFLIHILKIANIKKNKELLISLVISSAIFVVFSIPFIVLKIIL